MAARPRGGEWLADEVDAWQRRGIDTVLSLLTKEEERDLDLTKEASEVEARRMEFMSFPIADRDVPASERTMATALRKLDDELSSGRNVVMHCRQGVGRTGLVAACLLVTKGWKPETAVDHLTAIRRIAVPDTIEQRRWIDRYAEDLLRKVT